MANKVKFLLLTAFLITLSAAVSNAAITFQDEESASLASAIPASEQEIFSPNGLVGDFEVLGCAIPDEGQLTMNPATPDWSTENIGGCAGDPDCILGIFSKFSDSTGGDLNTCSWINGAVNVFGGGILRYSGVDPFNPVIGLALCNSGVGIIATAPSVVTEANSVAVRIFAADVGIAEGPVLPDFGFGQIVTSSGFQASAISFFAVGQPFAEAGDTGTLDLQLADTGEWRACTIALRMEGAPPPANVPTISEWGLIATAGVLGIIALIAIRRKKAVV